MKWTGELRINNHNKNVHLKPFTYGDLKTKRTASKPK